MVESFHHADEAENKKKRRRRGAKGREKENAESINKKKSKTHHVTKDAFDGDNSGEKNNDISSTRANEPIVDTRNKNVFTSLETANKKKRKPKRSSVPKPGQEGYLTPTQLRNARKRRAKQRKQNEDTNQQDKDEDTTSDKGDMKARKKKLSKKKRKKNNTDPSTKYLSNPIACPLVEKSKQYFSSLNTPFQIYLSELEGWRTVSKLPVRGSVASGNDENETCTIGLFQPKSHKIIAIPNYVAHHPSINVTINNLHKICNKLKVKPYEEKDGSGYLRYVCINVDRATKYVQLTLVWNSPPYEYDNDKSEHGNIEGGEGKSNSKGEKQLNDLTKALISQKDNFKIHSIWVHFNAKWKHADGIFDFGTQTTCFKLWKNVYGPEHIIETLDIPDLSKKVKLHFQPNVFRQANLDAFTKIVIAIRKYIIQYISSAKKSKGRLPSCLELYGGVGTLGLSLYDVTGPLLSSDENPFNKNCFIKSVELLPKKYQDKITYVSKNATAVVQGKDKYLSQENEAEIVIVDPPRKGLDEFVLQSLTQDKMEKSCIFNKTKLLVYVSCGFDAFERDCNALLKSKEWTLDHAEGHILFPGSNAIETLAFFKSK